MECPHCKSQDTRKFSVIYESGSTHSTLGGVGVGIGEEGLLGGLLGGSAQSQTLLARRVTPPAPPEPFSGVVAFSFAVVFLVMGALFYSFTNPTFGIAVMSFALVPILVKMLRREKEKEQQYQDVMRRWTDSWLCTRCGRDFIEQTQGVASPEPLESKIRFILRAQGKIAATRCYREWTGADLQTAKHFVEGL